MESGIKIFPFYVVVDISISMRDCLPALNEELPALKQAVYEDPIVGELARFSIITFNDRAEQALPLSDLFDVEEMPQLTAAGSTSYARAFEMLHAVLPHDMEWFKAAGARVFRPVVFFITDGQPNAGDPWREWRSAILAPDFTYRPHIVAFGFGNVKESTLSELATFKAYAANRGESPSSILREIAQQLTNSIIASSNAAMAGQSTLIMPQSIEGMYEIELDVV